MNAMETVADHLFGPLVNDTTALIEHLGGEIMRLRRGLREIASYEDGPVVAGKFDDPASAGIARELLERHGGLEFRTPDELREIIKIAERYRHKWPVEAIAALQEELDTKIKDDES
jgi:hypothetical protein